MVEHVRIDLESAFVGSLQLMQLCFPHMRDQDGGSVINMGSSYGIRCEPGFLAYAAAKEAIRALTRTAAREWGKHKIRVNTILPGIFDTPLMNAAPEPVKAALAASVPFPKRLGQPPEYASLALEMIRNTYFNGETVRLDGAIRMAPR